MRIIGNKFNAWKVLSFGEKKKYRDTLLCECVCGTRKAVDKYSLLSGRSKSCGCLRYKANAERLTSHGMSRTRLYRIWHSMLCRCGQNQSKGHPRYSGRGIKVCKTWLSFSSFADDMMSSYNAHCKKFGERDTTIERMNNDRGYSKENCRWATRFEQMQNTHRSKRKYG